VEDRIKEFLKTRKEEGAFRALTHLSSRNEVEIEIEGCRYIDFSSNNYLGLSSHPALVEAAKNALDKYGVGSLGSRLLSGSFDVHDGLETKTAEFKQKEAALVFNTGYQANVGIISALCGKEDLVLSDRLSHASIIDGVQLSGASHFRFRHNNIQHLEDILKRHRKNFRHALVITESVFSMDGDLAPLEDLVRIKNKYNALLFVDEAHATGVFGKTGAGFVEQEKLSEEIDLIMGTFSKALGSFGAYLACSRNMKNYLINTCRSFIYSTSLPPAVAAADLAAIDVVKKERQRARELLGNSSYFRSLLSEKGLKVLGSSQIVPVVVGENAAAVKLSNSLKKNGFWVLPIRHPTVPKGSARLRFSLNFGHSREMLKRVAEVL